VIVVIVVGLAEPVRGSRGVVRVGSYPHRLASDE